MGNHRRLFLSVLMTPLLSGLATAQNGEDDAKRKRDERALRLTRARLEERPTHAALFDRYFNLLVETNSVAAELDALKKRIEEDKDDALQVVLGRTLLRSGKEDEALEVLDSIPSKSAEVQGVLGDIYLKLAKFDVAARAFTAALPAAKTSEKKRVIYEKLGKAELALGKKQVALATWRKIGELDGGKFYRRLHVAELMAEAGLLDEASEAYAPLIQETESDPPRHCQVLRDVGRLRELQGQLPEALTTYEKVLELTGRGNWLRKEVEKRVVQIYRRTGRLEELVARLGDEVEQSPNDLALSELLADVLIEMRELDRAAKVLSEVSPRFPKDVRLARRVAELHVERKDIDAAIGEYQRIIAEKPNELELYLELGTLFARGERFNEAKNQWEKALAQNLTDATLCTRLASMYALWDRNEDAVRLYRRAIELEPESMVRRVDLAEFQFAHADPEGGATTLRDAIGVAGDKPRRLESIVGSLREHDMVDLAKECLGKILTAEPKNQEIRYTLADLLLSQGDAEAAVPLLWQIVDEDDKGAGQRTLAANTLVNIAARARQTEQLIEDAKKRESAGAAFVAGRAYTRAREFHLAIKEYKRAIELRPTDIQSRRLLARLLAEEGDFDAALAQYAELGVVAPGERRRNFKEVAQLHLELYDLDKATDTWERAMRDNPDNPAVFLQVGKEFMQLSRIPEAIKAFEQAARLRPTDPDVLIRYADALRQYGKIEDAEGHLRTVATGALDARDRAYARKKLFELYAEQGSIDKKIAGMQSAVIENPYDADTPQLLADLYNRTGDYLLGLEMIEHAVKFQPRNRELLTRRAELLEALEEWEKARDQHTELLKFPDADRDLHLVAIGRAQFEIGDAEEAKTTFRKIRDRGRVRKLYDKYRLHDEAVDYFKRAIARNPSDFRAYYYLGAEYEKQSKRKDAIAVLERALNMRPYYRQALELVGKLYVQDGRREDAVKVGMRLFGLRGEQVEKTAREQREQSSGRSRFSSYSRRTRNFSQRRLTAARSYFDSRGLKDEWGQIIIAEARRRPADELLLNEVRSHYKWREKSASKFGEFVDELLAADWTKVKVPPGYTKRSYRQRLEREKIALYKEDAKVAEKRLEELAGDERTVLEFCERAKVNQAMGQLDAVEADLKAALALDAIHPVANTLMVETLVEGKKYADAIPYCEALIRYWDERGESETAEELARRREVSFRRGRKDMLDKLPRRIRRKVTSDDLRAVRARTRQSSWVKPTTISFPEAVPQKFAAFVKLIRLRKAADQQDELRETVARAMASATTLAERSHLGTVLFQEELKDQARTVLESVMATAKELRDDPIQVYFWQNYSNYVNSAAKPLGDILAEAGDVFDAYRILRDHGHTAKAELLLRTSGKTDELIASLEGAVKTQGERLTEARAGASQDLRAIELDYRDAVIKFCDYWVGEKNYEKAEEIYEASLDLLPDDLQIRNVLATLRLRRGDYQAAVAMHHDIIQVKRRRRRASGGDTAVPPTRLQPRLPDQSASGNRYSSFGPGVFYSSSGGYYYSGSYYSSRNRFDVSQNYERILGIYAQRNNHDGVLDTLRKIMQEDPAAFRNMAWEVLDTLRNQDLGKKKLPILRILKGVVKDDEWLTLEYGRACSEENDLKEAKRTFEKLLTKSLGSNSWYVEEAEEELEKVMQKLGEGNLGVPELRAKVEKEPENVRHRMRLARRLIDEHQYADALKEAQVIVEKAPYMMKAKEMVVEAATAADEHDVSMAMLRRLFDESTSSNDKLRRGITLANWLHADGEETEAFEIVEGLEMQSGGSRRFSAGNWFLDKNQMETALEHFEKELEKTKARQYDQNRLRKRIARLELASSQIDKGVRRYLDALDEAGSLADREARFKDLLTMVKGYPKPQELLEFVSPLHGKRETVEDHLVMAAVNFAVGNSDAAEADIKSAVEMSPKEVYLFPLLLGMRRLNDDYDGALTVLDQMQRVYGGSDSMQWTNGVSLTERDQLKMLRAQILEDAGRIDEAGQLIESLLDETDPSTMQKLSTIYTQRKNHEKALEWYRKYTAKLGTREQSHLRGEADILFELRRLDECLKLAKEAWLMDPNDRTTRSLLIKIYRELDQLPEFVKELEEQFAKDFRDSDLRSSLLNLYKELERFDDRKVIFERMLEEEDLEESAIRSLISLANERGDADEAIALMKRRLALKGGEEKKDIHRDISSKLVVLGRIDEALEHYKESLELDTAAGQLSLGRWLQRRDRMDAAIAAYEKVLELDDDNEDVLRPFLQTAWKNKDWTATFQRLIAFLEEDHGESGVLENSVRRYVLDALEGTDDATRKAVLAGEFECKNPMGLAIVANLASAQWASAESLAEKVLADEPGDLIALDGRRLALRYQDKHEELIEATERLRQAMEKEYVVNDDWEYSSRAGTLQNQMGQIAMELGDEERAEKLWRQSPIRRTPYSNPFSYYRSDWQVRYTAGQWMNIRRPDRALKSLEREFLLRETAPWSVYTEALDKVGREAEVEEFAWKRLLDPMELYGIKSGSYGWIWSGGEYREAAGMQDFLVAFYKKRNRMDELRTRAETLLEDPATRRQARNLLQAIAQAQNDALLRAQAEDERLHREADGAKLKEDKCFQLAKLWNKAGDYDKAFDYMRNVLDFDSEAVKRRKRREGNEDWWVERGTSGRANPFAFGFNRSYSSWYSWSDRGNMKQLRAFAATLLFRRGENEKAMEIETDLTDSPAPEQRKKDIRGLASNYSTFLAHQHAARIYRKLLDDESFKHKEDERISLLRSLEEQYRKLGDTEKRVATAQEHRELLEKKLAEAPGPHDFSTRSSIASLAMNSLNDPQAALEHLEFNLKFSPRNRSYLGRRARALALLGQHDRAIEEFRALSELRRLRAEKDTPTEEAWHGLALLAAGKKDEAAEFLNRINLRMRDGSDLQREVRDALASLK